jgi:hypothetical protein
LRPYRVAKTDTHISSAWSKYDTHEEVAMRAAKLSVAALIAMPLGVFAQAQSPQSPTPQSQSTAGQTLEEGQTSSSCIRVDVNGQPIRFSELRTGDKLSFWMPQSSVGFYAEPGAPESTKLAVVSTEPARR